jgi:hypothetical protein
MAAAALERRYRRLLAWFPAEHRTFYAEEMIGVLLASAPDDQSRPGWAETIDIAIAGLRTRLRTWSRAEHVEPKWADAFAAFSVAAPVLMAFFLSFQSYIAVKFAFPGLFRQRHPGLLVRYDSYTTGLILIDAATITAIVALIVGPVLARRNYRLAARLTGAVPAIIGTAAVIYALVVLEPLDDALVGFIALYVLEVLALVISPGPRRGWQVIGVRGLIGFVVISAAALVIELSQSSFLQALRETRIELATMVVGLALVLIFSSEAIRRMFALLAVPAWPVLAYVQVYSVLYAPSNSNMTVSLLYLPTLVIAALIGLAVWRASRQQPPASTTPT